MVQRPRSALWHGSFISFKQKLPQGSFTFHFIECLLASLGAKGASLLSMGVISFVNIQCSPGCSRSESKPFPAIPTARWPWWVAPGCCSHPLLYAAQALLSFYSSSEPGMTCKQALRVHLPLAILVHSLQGIKKIRNCPCNFDPACTWGTQPPPALLLALCSCVSSLSSRTKCLSPSAVQV